MAEYKSEYPGVIHFEKKGHVAYLRFDNPKNLNALSEDMLSSLDKIFTILPDDDDIWGVIMTGTGRSFISGADLSGSKMSDFDVKGPIYKRRLFRKYVHDIFNKVYDYPNPVIAAINGYALGGGAELALCCDIRIASSTAKIGFPEPRLGNFPGYEGPTRAMRQMPMAGLKEMLFPARHFLASEAKELGYCSRVVEPENLMAACEELMGIIVAQAPIAVQYSKLMCNRGIEMSVDACLEYERMLTATLTTTEDWKEGMAAFHEKRKPVFVHN